MKKPYTSFVTGLLVGVALFSGTTAYAAGIMAERSTNRIFCLLYTSDAADDQ